MNQTTKMENLKPLSMRIDPETLKLINALVLKYRYWKRNAVINGILTAVVDTFTPSDIYDMVRYSRRYDEKPSGSFHHNGRKKSLKEKSRA